LSALGGLVKRLDRPRLAEGVLATEQRRAVAPDRRRQVLGLQAIRVDCRGGDPLDAVRPPQLDRRAATVPRVAE
jgi:hypothetical protein